MANAYVVTSVFQPPSTDPDPQVIISGTVNGVAVTVSTWKSVYQSKGATAVSFMNWISPLMLAEYNKTLPPTTSTPPTSSWSQ
jgi:hypothetical protein